MTTLSKFLSLKSIFIFAFLCTSTRHLWAETIFIGLGKQGTSQLELPDRGATQESVENKFGPAISVVAPVGEPPITTWHYSDFSVYFEANYVIHSVKKHAPKAAPSELAK